MHTERQKQIIKVLRHNDHKGIPFVETKRSLLERGYTENEITYCLYSAPYDGKPNKPKENPLEKIYKEHPQHAEKIAKNLLKDLENKQASPAVHGIASYSAPSPHARAYHQIRMFDLLGVPYFTLFSTGIALGILILIFQWPRTILDLYILGIFLLIGYKLWRRRRRR